MKVLLFGAFGQLGTDLQKTNPGHDLTPLSHADADVTDAKSAELVRARRPDAVLSTAAYHRTDECEDFPEKAFQVNAVAPRALARACADVGARFVHFSTDYVFDGRKRLPYREGDKPGPLNVYGISKLAGEHAVLAASDRHVVARTASLFGAAGSSGKGGNFVEMVVGKSRRGEPLEVVDDLVMSPTYTRDLAALTWTLLEKNAPGGLYHLANGGTTSWYEFARKIFSLLKLSTPLKPVPSSARPTKAPRPAFSALASERLPDLGLPMPRVWQDAVKAYLVEKQYLPS